MQVLKLLCTGPGTRCSLPGTRSHGGNLCARVPTEPFEACKFSAMECWSPRHSGVWKRNQACYPPWKPGNQPGTRVGSKVVRQAGFKFQPGG
eukprot:1483151-Rhodomonas_salina.3